MNKYIRFISLLTIIMMMAAGCGGNADNNKEPVVEDYDAILRGDQSQVIVRDEPGAAGTETAESETAGTVETEIQAETEQVIPYADRTAGENAVAYQIGSAVYEEGAVRVEYPQLTGMSDEGKQQALNEKIRAAAVGNISTDNVISYELTFETATEGSGIVSFIFRGTSFYANSAYPNNIVRTLNIDLNTGKNVRLKDFADMALVVSSLELSDGYTIINEGVDMGDFSAYLNNGAMTDYAVMLLDYDIDLENLEMIPTGYSAIRDNHLILFMEAEHAMGDYVELEFHKNL